MSELQGRRGNQKCFDQRPQVKLPEGSPEVPIYRLAEKSIATEPPASADKVIMNLTELENIIELIDRHLYGRVGDIDQTNPRSIANLIPAAMLEALKRSPLTDWEASVKELEQRLFKDGEPDPTASRLKLAFWEEYDKTIANGYERMDMTTVYRGNCTGPHFHRTLLTKPGFLAWLLQPPPSWTASLKGIAVTALRRMEEAVQVPIIDPHTKEVNVDLIKVQKAILDSADNRLNGAIVQRIHQTQQSLHLHGKASAEVEQAANQKALETMTMDDINTKIAQLERRSAQAQLPGVIDVDMLKEAKAVTMVGDGTPTNKNDSPGAD